MVELGVPSVLFGPVPDPAKVQPTYPGVSPKHFNPAAQLVVYRQMLKKEFDGVQNNAVSQNTWFKKMGYKAHPGTGRRLASELEPTSPETICSRSDPRTGGIHGMSSDVAPLPPLRQSGSNSCLSATKPLSSVLSAQTPEIRPEDESIIQPSAVSAAASLGRRKTRAHYRAPIVPLTRTVSAPLIKTAALDSTARSWNAQSLTFDSRHRCPLAETSGRLSHTVPWSP